MTGFLTDKVANGYLPTYLRIASEIGTDGQVLELGVDDGHSIRMWESLFPDGRVAGVDHRPECEQFAGEHFVLSDQADQSLIPKLAALGFRWFDLIVDDASHDGDLTWASLRMLWAILVEGGTYVIEDWGVAFEDCAPMHSPSMLRMAELLPHCFDPNDALHWPDLGQITYLPGLIILEKL